MADFVDYYELLGSKLETFRMFKFKYIYVSVFKLF